MSLLDQRPFGANVAGEGARPLRRGGCRRRLAAMPDSAMQSVMLQELNPDTGDYVDGDAVPVESKADVIGAGRR